MLYGDIVVWGHCFTNALQTPGSIHVGAGDPAQNPDVDITGAARPSTPAIGAFEP
jgi:hypothetical protein